MVDGKSDNLSVPQLQFSIDHRFARNSPLRFVVFIYNLGSKGRLDAVLQAQILRGDQPVFTSPASKVVVAGKDLARIPYGAEIPLNSLAPGRYVLQVTVTDLLSGASAQRRTNLVVD